MNIETAYRPFDRLSSSRTIDPMKRMRGRPAGNVIKQWVSRLKSNIVGAPIPVTLAELRSLREGPRVLSNSIPKAGTHLTERVLRFTPMIVSRWRQIHAPTSPEGFRDFLHFVNGRYICTHLYWTEELSRYLQENGVKVIFTIRDLRDVAVSRSYYHSHTLTSHKAYDLFNALETHSDRLSLSIRGAFESDLHPLDYMVKGYLPWLSDPNCLVVRFEDLVGAAGGGSDEKQREVTRAIIEFIGEDSDSATIDAIVTRLFSRDTPTFRQGKIGSWRNEFTEQHKAEFKKVANDGLIALGYETDDKW